MSKKTQSFTLQGGLTVHVAIPTLTTYRVTDLLEKYSFEACTVNIRTYLNYSDQLDLEGENNSLNWGH